MRRALLTLAFAALAGCSSYQEVSATKVAAQNLLTALNPQEATPFPEPTRAQLDEDGRELIRAFLPQSDVNALLFPIGQNGPVVTWTSVDARTLALKDGLVSQTRGLGADLMSSQLPPLTSLSRGQGQVARMHSYLGPNDQTVLVNFTCTLANRGGERVTISGLSYDTRKVSETCTAEDLSFENLYWFQSGTKIRQSVQWISPYVGNVALYDLRR